MAKSTNQKAKILYLEKILQGTDETHPCTMQEILGRLQEYGISAERKSIYDDMEVLRSFGMDIKFKRGKSTGYYVTGQKAATEALADGVREERSQKFQKPQKRQRCLRYRRTPDRTGFSHFPIRRLTSR